MNKVEFSFTADLVRIESGELPNEPIKELKPIIEDWVKQLLRDAGFDKVSVRNLKVFEHTAEG